MTMSSFACRLCRRSLADEAGCSVCLPIKQHLIPLEAADEDAVPLAVLAQETASLLRAQLKQLKAAQASANGYDATLADESRAHANSLSKLLDSARKLQEDGAAAVEVMSFQEKSALMVEFFDTLPPAYRRQLIERLESSMTAREPDDDFVTDDAN